MDVKNLNLDNITLEYVLSDKAIFSALFNVLDIHLFAIARDGNYIIKNKILDEVLEKLYPIQKPDNLNAKDIDPVAWNDCVQVMETGKTNIQEEQAPNGHFYLSVKSPLVHQDNVIGVIGIAVDITKQKQAKIAKSEFLLNMQHDLRTPFSGIYSISKMLRDTEKDAGRKELQGMVVDSANRLLQLLDQVLEISRLGDNPLVYSEFNVKDAANEVAELLHAEIHAKGLSFSLDCQEALIKTDRMRFSRILMNLLGNAVKFTEKGTIGLKIILNDYLLVEVSDTGIGIPADKLDFIFEKFAKLKLSYKDKSFTGSGIGLHIVKQFVNDLGGLIKVQSTLDQGSIFTCKLPLLPLA